MCIAVYFLHIVMTDESKNAQVYIIVLPDTHNESAALRLRVMGF